MTDTLATLLLKNDQNQPEPLVRFKAELKQLTANKPCCTKRLKEIQTHLRWDKMILKFL